MVVTITLTLAGTDTGPFNLYSDTDGYSSPFEVGVSKAALISGTTYTTVPNGTTTIRVYSQGVCINYVDLTISGTTTTTSSTSSTSTTSTTSTSTTPAPATEYKLMYYSSAFEGNRAIACAGTYTIPPTVPISVFSPISNPYTTKTLYNDNTYIAPWIGVPADGDYIAFYVAGFPGTMYVGNVSSAGEISSIVICT